MFIVKAISFLLFASIISLPLMVTPLRIGIVIFVITFLMCVLLGLLVSRWFAYILFLIYIGGLIVIFIYICLLCSNYQFFPIPPILSILLASIAFLIRIVASFQELNFGFAAIKLPEISLTGIEMAETYNISILGFLASLLFVNLLAIAVVTKGNGSVRRFQTQIVNQLNITLACQAKITTNIVFTRKWSSGFFASLLTLRKSLFKAFLYLYLNNIFLNVVY